MEDYDEQTSTYTLKIKSKSDEHEGTQKKTFTKWINAQLSKGEKRQQIDDLFADLKDGTKLLDLLEVLCGKKIRREKGRMRVHQLNNVNNALRTLQQEKVKLVNISNEDIVNGNPKLTLGLIWNIISHFQLHSAVENLVGDSVKKATMEESLLNWCKTITKGYKDVDIRNFTTSWRDGLAFNAIIHRFRPHLFDYNALLRNTPSVNLEHAFSVAQKDLGIDRLLDPEDVTQNRPDKKSIIMYVGSLAKTFADDTPVTMSPEVVVSRESDSEEKQLSPMSARNGQVVVHRAEKISHRTEKTVKRTVTSTTSEQTVKRVMTSNDSSDASVLYSSTATVTTRLRHPPTQHSSVTVVQQSLQERQPIIERPLSFTERTLQERPLSFTEMTDSGSVRDSVGSFRDSERESITDREWEDYTANLGEVLQWLTKAEDTLKNQERISGNVDVVKDQFHEHEDFMMDLTNHQANVGGVLEFGNQLISEGLVSEKEENEIRDQMMSLNDRWEALRISAMERQSRLHEQLMSLQQNQIDQLADWLTEAEKTIEKQDTIGSDLDAVKAQVEEHKVFQEDLENQQQKVNSLTHMVVVVDENAGENATADLEEQLAVLGERWSSVCKWTEQRWIMLQDVLTNWQEYRDEERRLSDWLGEKERQVDEMKGIDLGDVEDVRSCLKQCMDLEQEMEAQQATFTTFNEAAERVAENLDENSPGVDAIQDKMEEFNDHWNKVTTQLSDRLTLLKSLESKLQTFHTELDEKMQWVRDTETLLKSPGVTLKDETIPMEKLLQQSDLVESLESAMKQIKPSVATVQRKGEELIDSCGAQGNVPVTLEQTFTSFNERWENVGKMLQDRKQQIHLLQKRREVQELCNRLEGVLVDAEKVVERFGDIPEIEYEMKSQLEQCKHKYDSLVDNDGNLTKLKDLAKNLSREDRFTSQVQSSVKKIDDRWSAAKAALEDRRRQLQGALESGPPKQYLNTMDAVLLKIKNMESILGGEFFINDTAILEEQLKKYKELQEQMTEQQKNMDYLNSTGEKFMRSLPRAKSDQLRTKLTDLNHKWSELNTMAEKRIVQVHKAVNQNKQYSEEMKGLFKWMDECCDFVKNQAPAAGDPETLEAQLDQSEALQRDITKLQRKLDSLNETGAYMVGHADQQYCSKLRDQLEDVNIRWEEVMRTAARQKDNLVAALEKYEKLSRDMKEMTHWIIQTERSIAEDDKDIEKGEIAKEKVEHYRDLQQDVSKRAPSIVRINTTCNQLIDHTKQGSTQALKDGLKRLNSDWARLKSKVALRQRELKQTIAEMEHFQMALERDRNVMVGSDTFAEECYDYLDESEDVLEEKLRNLNRHINGIRDNGPGSVHAIADTLITRKISAKTVMSQLGEYQTQLNDVRQRVDKTRQVLEGEILKRQQMRRDFDTIRTWIVKIEILISTRVTRNEPMDERELKAMEEEFSLNQALLQSVEKALNELSGPSRGGPYSSFSTELSTLKDKWNSVRDTFADLKSQPTRKLETEFEEIQGQILTNLDMIHRGVRKLKLESADVRDTSLLLDQAQSYKEELANLAKDVEQVKKIGETLVEKRPDDSREGIERRVDEVCHEHTELVNKVDKKEQQFREAHQLAEQLEDDMSRLEIWLQQSKEEMKQREEDGFPDDVDTDIKWTKNLIQEVTGRMSEVQQLTQVGRELVDLSETGQLGALEDRLTVINNDWEELSSLAEQRLTVLPKYKQKVSEFEKAVDQMNCWLEEIERETSEIKIHEDQLEQAEKRIDKLNKDLRSKEPQLERIRLESGEFVHKGRLIMEPYKRLLTRRWDDLTAKINELERELNRLKQQVKKEPRVETEILVTERKVVSRPGVFEEWVRTEEQRENEAGAPYIDETITTRRTYTNSNKAVETTTTRIHTELSDSSYTQDDFQLKLDAILDEIKELEDELSEIENPKDPREHVLVPVREKIQSAEKRLDILQPRVELVLKESKLIAARDGSRKEEVRQALLDLSGRWLRACDELDRKKKAVEIVPKWYEFKSSLNDIKLWLARIDGKGRADKEEVILSDEVNLEFRPDELEEQNEKYETLIKNLELLEEQGINLLSPVEFDRLRRRYRQINAQFLQYKRPDSGSTYRITVLTGDVKDADTRANVSIKLYGEKGTSPDIRLEKSETYNTKFCRDQLDMFPFNSERTLGDLSKIRVWHDNTGTKPEWFVKALYVEDKTMGKVFSFNVNEWIGQAEKDRIQYLICSGYYVPEDGEDIMTKHRLARVQWKGSLVQPEKHVQQAKPVSTGAGWELVNDITQLSEELKEAEAVLNSEELQGTDFEDFSNQEDKLKQIGDKLERLEPKASVALNRGELVQPVCEEKELDAVKKACSRFHLSWNTINKNYKARLVRWEKSVTVWRQYHCDLKDLTSWLTLAEKSLADSKTASGDLDVDKAKVVQKDLEDGIASHQTTVTTVNGTGEEIIKQSTQFEGDMLREKLNTVNRRWQVVCSEVADRRDRFKEERMQTEEFMDESADLLHWLDETEVILRPKDPSPADEDAIEIFLDKVTDLKKEKEAKEDTYRSIRQSGERLLTKPILSKPNNDAVRARLDLVNIRWERLCSELSPRLRGLETKLQRVCQFLAELEELSLWAATTRELLETQVKSTEFSKGENVEMIVEPKTVQDSLKSRQPALDSINGNMTRYRRESKADGGQVPKELEDKVKLLNEDWSKIASLAASLFAAKIKPRKAEEDLIVEVQQTTEESAYKADWGLDRSSPFPKFDKAVSELHEWLDTIEDMMRTEKIVLGDKEDMDGLVHKQKRLRDGGHNDRLLRDSSRHPRTPTLTADLHNHCTQAKTTRNFHRCHKILRSMLENVGSVDDQLRSKQHLLDEIVAMGGTLREDAETEEDKLRIDTQMTKLRVHWDQVVEKSTVWKSQIDFLIEEWKRFLELRDELTQWMKKADAYFEREENVYVYTVSELEEQIDQHKEFEEEVDQWRGSITAVNQCGENLIQEFSQYEASELRNIMTEFNERWHNTVNRSDARRKHLKEAFDRMVRFHEDMINALTWLTSAESKVAELDSAVEATSTEERVETENLKTELNHLEEDINAHQEMFASLNENGHQIMEEMEQGDVLTAVQSKLDDMNDRWQSLNLRTLDIRDRLEETATEWRQLLIDLQEALDWIARADGDLNSQQPLGGDLEAVQNQNEAHQGFKGRLNVRRLMVDKALDSGKRCLEEFEAERSGENASKQRIATSLQRQIDVASERWLKLCSKSEEWQKRVDDAFRRLQVLQGQMEEIDQRLSEAEQIRNRWTPVQDMVIDSIQEQLEGMKAFQAKIASLQHMFENMGSTEAELHRKGVTLSTNLQNRIDQLYKRWKQLQNQMLSRQTVLQDACSDIDGTSLSGLAASVEPPWERAVALNKVPYYINHKTETTQWDHPRMTELYHQIAELNDIKYSAYRTAMKLRCIQKATCLDLVNLDAFTKAFEQHNLQNTKNENYIGVRDMVNVLNSIYASIEAYKDKINVPFCVDLTLNWLLNVYDSGRVGKIRSLSFKVGLVAMSRAHLEDKYRYLFKLVADSSGFMDHKQFGLLLHDVVQVPRQLGEIAAFGGSNIEPSVRSCFEKNKAKNQVDCPQFMYWLSAEPQSIVWLPTLHRMAAAEAVKHKAKCSICKEYPIVGFRFRCLKCFNYDLCQSCFWSGRTSHHHRLTHPMHQYCLSTTSGEDAKDFLSMVRNKFKTRRYKNKPPKKLGYLPIQTVMEGGNLETPPMPSPQQAVNNEVHNRLGMYAHRLAEAEGNNNRFPNKNMDDEHQLIAQYCQSLKNDSVDMPRSPSQIVMSLDAEEKDDLETEINKLEDENRALQEEYERLKTLREQENPSENESTAGQQSRDAELLAEAKLLRQHKGRLEARMQVLEDHNRQLEAQLQRLRQLLDQPGEQKALPTRATPTSSVSSLGDSPYNTANRGRNLRPDKSTPDIEQLNGGMKNGLGDDPDLREVMKQIDTSFPSERPSHQDTVGELFSSANQVNKAVESLVEALTEDEGQDSS